LNLPSTAEGTSVKLFIGGIPIHMTDDELKAYFEEFGSVLDCHSLAPKNNNPELNTKAAFVRFSRKSEAQAAMDACDKKRSFPGIERTMDVRIAESKTTGAQSDRLPPAGGLPYQQPTRYGQNVRHNPHSTSMYNVPAMVGMPPTAHSLPGLHAPVMRQPRTIGIWTEYYTADGRPYYHNITTNATSWETPVEFRVASQSQYRPQPPIPASGQSGGGVADVKGPPGSNLFVFHVPIEWSDHELHAHFAPYGNLLSARVARERETNRPKGFGFVSFDNAASANAAVNSMNGFMVSNGKRLKVSIKKGEDGSMGPMMAGPPRPYGGARIAPY
jgi:CUG-BP- and ETR3-like factor